jgi:carboxypeptidase family protein
MSRLRALALVGAVLFLACVDLTAQAPQAGRLTGLVVDQVTGAPIVRARIAVTIRAGAQFETTTDQDGRYTFTGLEPGPYRISVQRVGYATPASDQLPALVVAAGKTLAAYTIALQRTAAIAGRILDPFGDPLQDVIVRAVKRAAGTPPTALHQGDPLAQGVRTNDLGEFRVFGLSPGEYSLLATPQPFSLATAQVAATMQPSTYYPGVIDPAAAEVLTIAAGQTLTIELRLVAAMTYTVTGVVLDESGAPMAGLTVTLRGDPQATGVFLGMRASADTDDTGRFVIEGVPSGAYFAAGSGFDPVEVRVNERDVDDLSIVVRR